MSSLPQTQAVYRIAEFTGPEGVKRFEEDVPTKLNKNEVLVKIKAVALNYRDVSVSNNAFITYTKNNVIPCSDGSGEVVAVGEDVQRFQVGDRIITNFDPTDMYGNAKFLDGNSLGSIVDGVLCQYRVFSQEAINKVPKDSHLSHEEAATLVGTGVTVWNSLYGSGKPFVAGQTVLMLGTGGVSITALSLAKAAGAITIITSSSDEKLKYAKEEYGADYVINYNKTPDWEKEVLKFTNGEGVDFVFETGGNGTIEKSILSTKVGGQVCLIGFLGQTKEFPDVVSSILTKSISVRGIYVGSRQLAEQLIQFVHAKKVHVPVGKVFGFSQEEVLAAYNNVKSQKQIGKTVIKVD
ncbi:hypothetical protein G6F57_008113 [Rhizopus arrhizus]|nr:hypothetical protein G6F23_011140 [Rhizopus arrhizus]KAG1408892.1 hypothetical protein G6F58_009434 [Rhizopus delemar]KAG0754224.1 hypothetical protein G6F24_012557 [Rhizopus arrhizus]KAG0781594.1 hypothetical protein G6F21_011567 [Rhizopus arrhizus]KAG0807827.1 hypothetical protein G6F20_010066 [Rhizopus arrhizus]